MKTYSSLLFLLMSTVFFAQYGTLDPSFGWEGIATASVGRYENIGAAIALQPDGKIVIAGYATDTGTNEAAIARFLPDGSLDTDFGNDGTLHFPLTSTGSLQSYITSVSIQPDGKILMGGYTWDITPEDMAAVRLNPDGSFDSSFGTGGIVIADGGGNEASESMVLLDDGSFLLAGYQNTKSVVAKFTSNGTLETNFGNNGWSMVDFNGNTTNFVRRMTIQEDGKILLVGRLHDQNRRKMSVARLNADGSLDSTFGSNGTLVFNIGEGNDLLVDVEIQNDGKIIVGGYTGVTNDGLKYDFAAIRLLENGDFDLTYGNQGVATARIVDGMNYAENILLQPDGKLLIVGNTYNHRIQFGLVRLDRDGNLDDTFGQGGIVDTSLFEEEYNGADLALQDDGNLIVGGTSQTSIMEESEFAVFRYLNNILATEDFNEINFQVYPNPTTDYISIQRKDDSSDMEMEVFDVLGKKVFIKQTIENGNQIDISHLKAGIYFLRITVGYSSKVVKIVKK